LRVEINEISGGEPPPLPGRPSKRKEKRLKKTVSRASNFIAKCSCGNGAEEHRSQLPHHLASKLRAEAWEYV